MLRHFSDCPFCSGCEPGSQTAAAHEMMNTLDDRRMESMLEYVSSSLSGTAAAWMRERADKRGIDDGELKEKMEKRFFALFDSIGEEIGKIVAESAKRDLREILDGGDEKRTCAGCGEPVGAVEDDFPFFVQPRTADPQFDLFN